MNKAPLILAIDQGTTSSRAIVFNANAEIVAVAQTELPQRYPAEGWVEHDPEAIWETSVATARQAMQTAEAAGGAVVALGVANQRETTLIWDRDTGRPLYNAIVWQDRRTAERCRKLQADGLLCDVQSRTGLVLDPYFSATKASWILEHVEGAKTRAAMGELAFGTIDSFLLWRLTNGRVHATDATNASRTSLYDIHRGEWCADLCGMFGTPQPMLPEVKDCSADFGATAPQLFGRPIPILGVIGDQQAALVGQCGFTPGDVKSTFGTGGFVLVNTGEEPVASTHQLLTTIGYRLDGRAVYALEGSIFVAGGAVQWLRDQLGVIKTAAESEGLAQSLPGNGGVYLVPAFTGLGAPYWDPHARGALFGLTRATGAAELARAALESVCYQTHDLLTAITRDGVTPAALKVDGGMAANAWMLHFLADILDLSVERPKILETTALGAAYMAGRQAGVFGDLDAFRSMNRGYEAFTSQITADLRSELLSGWRNAVKRTLSSADA